MSYKKLADTIFAKYSARKKDPLEVVLSVKSAKKNGLQEGFSAEKIGNTIQITAKDLLSGLFAKTLFEKVKEEPSVFSYLGSYTPKARFRPLRINNDGSGLETFPEWGYNTVFIPSLKEMTTSFQAACNRFRQLGGKVLVEKPFEEDEPVDGRLWTAELLGWDARRWVNVPLTWGEWIVQDVEKHLQKEGERPLWIDLSLYEKQFPVQDLLLELGGKFGQNVCFLCSKELRSSVFMNNLHHTDPISTSTEFSTSHSFALNNFSKVS